MLDGYANLNYFLVSHGTFQHVLTHSSTLYVVMSQSARGTIAISVYVVGDEKRLIEEEAEKEGRPLSNFCKMVILREIERRRRSRAPEPETAWTR